MIRCRWFSVVVAVCVALPFVGFAERVHADTDPLRLSLSEAVKMAVENNLDVKAELYNPAAAEADIRLNKGIYDPNVNFGTTYTESNTQLANAFISGTAISRQKILQFNPGISQLIPIGGSLALTFNNTWNRNNADPARSRTDYYQSDLTLDFSQPLLKNFGREATELKIEVAKYGKEGAMEQFRTRLSDIVSQVRNQYFQLYSLRENLQVQITSLELARRILDDTRAQVKAGVLPAMEILNAEFGVATMERNLIDAERSLQDQEDSLRLLLQIPRAQEIVPTDVPLRNEYKVDDGAAIAKALERRPELGQLRATLKSDELQSRVAANRTLPDLTLTASTALTGLDGEYNRDLERVGSGRYPVWSIGLQLSYPLGNRAAENEHVKARLQVGQTQTRLRSLEESIINEVRAAIRALVSSYRQLDVTARGSVYAEERLTAYVKRQKVGLATTKDVLDVENDYVTAQGNHIRAIADYNNAITALWQASGELLDKEGITVLERDADALYGKNL